MKEIKAFKCDHCSKIYQRKGSAEKHEKACKNNSDNDRPCLSCVFMKNVTMPILIQDYDGYDETVFKDILVCRKFKKGIFPPVIERKGYAGYKMANNEFNIDENEPMPKSCDEFLFMSCRNVDDGVIISKEDLERFSVDNKRKRGWS